MDSVALHDRARPCAVGSALWRLGRICTTAHAGENDDLAKLSADEDATSRRLHAVYGMLLGLQARPALSPSNVL